MCYHLKKNHKKYFQRVFGSLRIIFDDTQRKVYFKNQKQYQVLEYVWIFLKIDYRFKMLCLRIIFMDALRTWTKSMLSNIF